MKKNSLKIRILSIVFANVKSRSDDTLLTAGVTCGQRKSHCLSESRMGRYFRLTVPWDTVLMTQLFPGHPQGCAYLYKK